MRRFETRLVAGGKPPYTAWTFVVLPAEIVRAWGPGSHQVRGTISGHPFRGTASRGEGVLRMPVRRSVREDAGLSIGDSVTVEIELDPAPRSVEIPEELQAVLDDDPDLPGLFAALPPSQRRAWASHVAGAKREETRLRRAAAAAEGIRARRFPGQKG